LLLSVTGGTSVYVVGKVHRSNSSLFALLQVVQVYMSWVKSIVPVPRWTLVGFQRVTLSLSSPHQLSFTITARQMTVWIDSAARFSVETGMSRFKFSPILVHDSSVCHVIVMIMC